MRKMQPDYNPNVPVSASEGLLTIGIGVLIAAAGWVGRGLYHYKKRKDAEFNQEMQRYRDTQDRENRYHRNRNQRPGQPTQPRRS